MKDGIKCSTQQANYGLTCLIIFDIIVCLLAFSSCCSDPVEEPDIDYSQTSSDTQLPTDKERMEEVQSEIEKQLLEENS